MEFVYVIFFFFPNDGIESELSNILIIVFEASKSVQYVPLSFFFFKPEIIFVPCKRQPFDEPRRIAQTLCALLEIIWS